MNLFTDDKLEIFGAPERRYDVLAERFESVIKAVSILGLAESATPDEMVLNRNTTHAPITPAVQIQQVAPQIVAPQDLVSLDTHRQNVALAYDTSTGSAGGEHMAYPPVVQPAASSNTAEYQVVSPAVTTPDQHQGFDGYEYLAAERAAVALAHDSGLRA